MPAPLQAWSAAIIVMGVSGAGKSTVASRLAQRLDRSLVEGDSLHPPQNIEKMSRGIALGDEDRLPWLEAIAHRIDGARNARQPIIVTCSALKRTYRGVLANGHGDVGFIYLQGQQELIAARLKQRAGHFMPPQLLDSQFAALQEPGPDEPSIKIAIDAQPTDIVDTIVEKLNLAR